LLLAMSNAGARDSFTRAGNEAVLREAILAVMGADFAIETFVNPFAIETKMDSSPRLTVEDVRRLWPEVLEEVKAKRRFTWILLSQNAQVADLRNGSLLLAMSNAGTRDSFARGGGDAVLREAIVTVMGADFEIETMVDANGTP
jgi:hypothetical protein